MGKINWGRIFAGGLVAGVVTFAVGGLITAIWKSEFEAGISSLGHPYTLPKSLQTFLVIFLLNLVLGIVIVWVYAGVRPRFGPGPKTAAKVGFVVWIILAVTDFFYMSIGVLPFRTMLAPIVAGLVASLAAAEAGAWLYKEGT
jgi:hypothetical protein